MCFNLNHIQSMWWFYTRECPVACIANQLLLSLRYYVQEKHKIAYSKPIVWNQLWFSSFNFSQQLLLSILTSLLFMKMFWSRMTLVESSWDFAQNWENKYYTECWILKIVNTKNVATCVKSKYFNPQRFETRWNETRRTPIYLTFECRYEQLIIYLNALMTHWINHAHNYIIFALKHHRNSCIKYIGHT